MKECIIKKLLLCMFAVSIVLLSSCGSNETDTINTSEFPVDPDKIIVGTVGSEKEILRDDKEYNEILSQVKERIKDSEALDAARLDDHDPETNEHLSFEIRENEVFIEFVYNESKVQKFEMLESGGKTVAKEINVHRIFFPLTGNYHDCFFIGKDAGYKETITLGKLAEKAELVTYISNLVAE